MGNFCHFIQLEEIQFGPPIALVDMEEKNMTKMFFILLVAVSSVSASAYQLYIDYQFPNELLVREPLSFPLAKEKVGKLTAALLEVKQRVSNHCSNQFKVNYGLKTDFQRFDLVLTLQRMSGNSKVKLTCLMPLVIEMLDQTGTDIQKLAIKQGSTIDVNLALDTGLLRVPVINSAEAVDNAIKYLVAIRLFKNTYQAFYDLAKEQNFNLSTTTVNALPMIQPWLVDSTTFASLSTYLTQLKCKNDINSKNCNAVSQQVKAVLQRVAAYALADRSVKELFQTVSTGSILENFQAAPQLLLFKDISSSMINPDDPALGIFVPGGYDNAWAFSMSLLQGLDVLPVPVKFKVIESLNSKLDLITQAQMDLPAILELAQMSFDYSLTQKTSKAVKTLQILLNYLASRGTQNRESTNKAALSLHKFLEMKKAIYRYSNQTCDNCLEQTTQWQQNAIEIQLHELSTSMIAIKTQLKINSNEILGKEKK